MIYELRTTPGAGAQTGCGVAGVYTLGLAYLFDDCQYSDNDYFVQFNEGKVSLYGRIGDFSPNKNPDPTINTNKEIKEI